MSLSILLNTKGLTSLPFFMKDLSAVNYLKLIEPLLPKKLYEEEDREKIMCAIKDMCECVDAIFPNETSRKSIKTGIQCVKLLKKNHFLFKKDYIDVHWGWIGYKCNEYDEGLSIEKPIPARVIDEDTIIIFIDSSNFKIDDLSIYGDMSDDFGAFLKNEFCHRNYFIGCIMDNNEFPNFIDAFEFDPNFDFIRYDFKNCSLADVERKMKEFDALSLEMKKQLGIPEGEVHQWDFMNMIMN